MRDRKRLVEVERKRIDAWRQEGLSIREMARRLNRPASTVSRELRRNATAQGGYDPVRAQRLATLRAKRPGCRKLTEEVRLAAYAKLREEGWSFGASCGRAKREGRPFVCKETLYLDYYARAKRGEDLPPLPRSKRKRHSRLPKSQDGRGRLPGRVDISERPFAAELREELGHWEGDLVNGLNGTGHYVTLTERATRLTRFRWVATKDASQVAAAFAEMFTGLPARARRTLTLDNGKEFARHEEVSRSAGVRVYFARPYHSWERGTNENRNGVVRMVLPKGSDFLKATKADEERIDRLLNDRPMACLGYATPREAFKEKLRSSRRE